MLQFALLPFLIIATTSFGHTYALTCPFGVNGRFAQNACSQVETQCITVETFSTCTFNGLTGTMFKTCGNGMLNGSIARCQQALASNSNCAVKKCTVDKEGDKKGAMSALLDMSNSRLTCPYGANGKFAPNPCYPAETQCLSVRFWQPCSFKGLQGERIKMCGNGMLNGSLALCQTAFAGTNCKVRECLVDRQLNQGAGSIAALVDMTKSRLSCPFGADGNYAENPCYPGENQCLTLKLWAPCEFKGLNGQVLKSCGNGMLNGSLAMCQTAFAGTRCQVRECSIDREIAKL